jgi:ribosomal protein S12 methylthiotransferase
VSARPPRSVWCATLGCDKNLVDSETLLGHFAARGVAPVAEPEDADVWVLNTCGFVAAARTDSRDALAELVRAKGPSRFLAVVGCWSQEHAAEIRRSYPGVDLVAGVGEFSRIVEACLAGRRTRLVVDPARASYTGLGGRSLLTPAHVAFVKLGEGCDGRCTFCRIPRIRGPLRSRPAEDVVAEVTQLAARGVQEIQLVSQNTAAWGRDRGDRLLDLVRRLDRVAGLRWIRLLYLYPGLLPVEQLLALLELPSVVPYLDSPIQHATPRLLRAMKRPGTVAATLRTLTRLREAHPDLVLRTTILLGFPGEEERDVEELADFLARVEFDHLGAYRYSPEVGTPAAALPDRVPDEVVADREARILDLQAEISLRRQESRLGREHVVVVDARPDPWEARPLLEGLAEGTAVTIAERSGLLEVIRNGGPLVLGRSYHYGYDLDGVVALPAGDLKAGDRVQARFLAVTPYDVWAVPVAGTSPERVHVR